MPNNPPPPGPPQIITLVPNGSGPSTTWKVQQNGNPPELPAQASVSIPKGTGATQFTVNIAGNPAGIQFHPQTPLTVWAGPKGTPQSGIDNQILGPVLTKDGKLVFYDMNMGDPVKLSYSIHFQGNVPSVDPIIDNGGGVGTVIEPPPGIGPGGGGGWTYQDILLPLSLALAAGIVLTLLFQRFWR